jgi:ABC-2 type transport system permease protein
MLKLSNKINFQRYLAIFRISFQQEFSYKLSFIMWRLRNVLQVFVAFYFWNTLFASNNTSLFGYDRTKILTYVFTILFMRAVVFSVRAVDVSGQIANGDLSNWLLKPIGYMKYWFTRDLSSKALNFVFAFFEILLLYLLLRPPLYLQTDLGLLLIFLVFMVLAIILFFFLLFVVEMATFWMPENGWAAQFLFVGIVAEFFSGGVFPLDIFPKLFQTVLGYLPFGYLLYFPAQVYLGKLSTQTIQRGLVIEVMWIVIFYVIAQKMWRRGLKNYASEGR